MQRRTTILIQKSRFRELTLASILQLTASLVGFMYFIGGIKPAANSSHVWSVVHGSENGTSCGSTVTYSRPHSLHLNISKSFQMILAFWKLFCRIPD